MTEAEAAHAAAAFEAAPDPVCVCAHPRSRHREDDLGFWCQACACERFTVPFDGLVRSSRNMLESQIRQALADLATPDRRTDPARTAEAILDALEVYVAARIAATVSL